MGLKLWRSTRNTRRPALAPEPQPPPPELTFAQQVSCKPLLSVSRRAILVWEIKGVAVEVSLTSLTFTPLFLLSPLTLSLSGNVTHNMLAIPHPTTLSLLCIHQVSRHLAAVKSCSDSQQWQIYPNRESTEQTFIFRI